jgi:copper chaperone CopZ
MTTTIAIAGMRTVHCVRAVRTALMALDGIESVDVKVGAATLEHPGTLDPAAVTAALAPTDYRVTSLRTESRALRIL